MKKKHGVDMTDYNKTNMKKTLLLLALICLPLFASAQTAEKQYYIYNIITFNGSIKNEGFKVYIDNGKTIEKLKNSEGKIIEFYTPAAALMYLFSLGWEFFENGVTTSGSGTNIHGTGSSSIKSTAYWIMRKPCTKEEFDKAVEEGIKKAGGY